MVRVRVFDKDQAKEEDETEAHLASPYYYFLRS
jgi:hypothetical protein